MFNQNYIKELSELYQSIYEKGLDLLKKSIQIIEAQETAFQVSDQTFDQDMQNSQTSPANLKFYHECIFFKINKRGGNFGGQE